MYKLNLKVLCVTFSDIYWWGCRLQPSEKPSDLLSVFGLKNNVVLIPILSFLDHVFCDEISLHEENKLTQSKGSLEGNRFSQHDACLCVFIFYRLQESPVLSDGQISSGHCSNLCGESTATEPSLQTHPEPPSWPGTWTELLHQSQHQKSAFCLLIGWTLSQSSAATHHLQKHTQCWIRSKW